MNRLSRAVARFGRFPVAVTEQYQRQVDLDVSPEEAFEWHQRPGALVRLLPPWQRVRILEQSEGIEPGARVQLRLRLGPLPCRWEAVHRECEPPRRFVDEQARGPFHHWRHEHLFESIAQGQRCRLTDAIAYGLRAGTLGRLAAGRCVRKTLDRIFAYRHRVTAADLAMHAAWRDRPRLTVAITGASGLIGRQLAAVLTTGGHRVIRLVRRAEPEAEDAIVWDPQSGVPDTSRLEGVDAMVHLAGENIAARRWTVKQRERLRESRVTATMKLCESLAAMTHPPGVLITASAIGFYGDRGEQWLDESAEPGQGFLAELGHDWEQAARGLAGAGTRVVNTRLGVVLTPAGGALGKMLPAFRAGMGGPLGSGRQWMSWVSIDDVCAAMLHIMMDQSVEGPVNLVAPEPVRQRDFAKTLGRVLRRPAFAPAPAFVLRLALGRMADEALLASARVRPAQLEQRRFAFRHADLEQALGHMLGRMA